MPYGRISNHFEFVFEKNSDRAYHGYRNLIVFENLCFRDGLAWKELVLKGKIKLAGFLNSSRCNVDGA